MNIKDFEPVLNGMTGAIFLVGRKRNLLFANNAAETLFGKHQTGIDFVKIVRHPECLLALGRVLSGQSQSDAMFELQQPLRTTYQIKVTALNAGKKSNTAPRAMISFDNISHIRDAQQMRSEFVANVSHELRSPLTALSGFIETLQTLAKDDPQAREKFLNIMAREAERMDRLIGDLLSLSRVEANKHMRPETVISVSGVVEQAIALLTKRAEKNSCAISFQATKGISDLVQGDADQLLQVFLNLIENALKYGASDKGVDVRLSNFEHVAGIDGPAISVQVTDYGHGMAPEHLPRLTERFYRVDNGRSRQSGGTGLGMAIVKHILSRHHGRLKISSTVGEGSNFEILLPYSAKNPELS